MTNELLTGKFQLLVNFFFRVEKVFLHLRCPINYELQQRIVTIHQQNLLLLLQQTQRCDTNSDFQFINIIETYWCQYFKNLIS